MLFVLILVLIASYELFEHRTSKDIGTSPAVVVTGISENRPLPDVSLTEANGHTISLSALHGKVVVLAPFATLCSATCAATTSAYASLEAEVHQAGVSSRVELVELSVDPTHDSAARLSAFAKLAGVTWTLATASPAQIGQLWSSLGQSYQVGKPTSALPRDAITGAPAAYGVTYANALYFLGTNGTLRISDIAAPQAGLDAATSQLLSAEGVASSAPSTNGWTVRQAFGNIEVLLNRRLPLR
jgi:cytochrome oxidase Cu insertion factor (SCO1/SenC/PrrC family)